MQLGYSILLRELIAATEVDYGDCSTFQITCPACHEAVFKAGKFNGDRQYFSHYAASKSDVRECELRVAIMAADKAATEAKNILGHGQTMEAFFGNFQQFVPGCFQPNDVASTNKRIAWMAARPSFIVYSDWLGETIRLNDLDDLWEGIVGTITEGRQQTEYWAKQQKRFALDFLEHLLAPNSRSAWRFIVCLSIILTKTIDDDIRHTLLFENTVRLKKLLTKLRNTRIKLPEDSRIILKDHADYSYSHLLGSRLMRIVLYLLLCIPYTDFFSPESANTSAQQARDILDTLADQ